MMRASLFAVVFVAACYSSIKVNGQCQQCNSPSFNSQRGCTQEGCSQQKDGPSFCHSFGQWYKSVYTANSIWPHPYVIPARNSVNTMYEVMISNGWRRQNLLGQHHFDEETQQLTQSGKLKVHWILTQTPPQRRNIFVERGANEAQTSSRIESIHQHTASMSPAPGPVSVTDTHLVSEGHPATAVDLMFTGYQASKPVPVLPKADIGTSK